MPTAQFIQDGDAIDYTPEVDTPAGTVVVLNGLVGVTKQDLKAGELGSIAVTGVFDFPKPTGADTGSGAGINVYWHEAEQNAQFLNTGAKFLGHTVTESTDDDTTYRVRLSQ